MLKWISRFWGKWRGDGGRVTASGSRLVTPEPKPEPKPIEFQFATPTDEPVRGQAANAVLADDRQEMTTEERKSLEDALRSAKAVLTVTDPSPRPNYVGPGHPDWAGRAEIPLVVGGWALPGHPMYFYQQFLKYQNDANGMPAGWKVIGWTPEGVSYLVPEAHWTEKERLSPFPTIRSEHNPYMTPEQVFREKLKAKTPALMSDAELDERINAYRAYTTTLNEKAAEVLDAVRAGAERHAAMLIDNNFELRETIEGFGPAKTQEARVLAWVKECGQRAVDKRLQDAVRMIEGNKLLSAIPVDNFIYEPPKPS